MAGDQAPPVLISVDDLGDRLDLGEIVVLPKADRVVTRLEQPDRVGEQPPQPERFRVPEATARLVNSTRQAGGRVIAVGTTVTRALESAAGPDGTVCPRQGWTELVLGPHRPARVVTGLVTGWHAPGASHLALLAAVAGDTLVGRAYEEAVRVGYRWHEFGDSCLLLP